MEFAALVALWQALSVSRLAGAVLAEVLGCPGDCVCE